MKVVTRSVTETRALGEQLGRDVLVAGDMVVLSGELGSGKTALAQGIGRGLDVDGHVVSPTFTLVREYEGRMPVIHVDVYRLDRVQEVIDLGLEEVSTDGVTFVEWGDAVDALLPEDRLVVELTAPDPSSEARRVRVRAVGPAWGERWEELAAGLAPWATEDAGAAGEAQRE
jgi:tRNA threonylcarbamoyladenosine biosynthesis protein TsaE